jgi:hypothetical protein
LRSGAPQSRDRPDAGAYYGPGSAKHHAAKSGMLHRARDTGAAFGFRVRAKRAPGMTDTPVWRFNQTSPEQRSNNRET